MNIVSDKRKEQARKHSRRSFTCVCGKICRGNGGWSSHKKARLRWQEARRRKGLQGAV